MLSGVTLDHEIRLNPPEKRLKCDVVAPGEQVRGWALEVDRGSEGIAVIRDQATAYRKVWNDPAFYSRYGKLPIPLWIYKDTARADRIMHAWTEVWPEGRWYMTTEARLPALQFVEWSAGAQRRAGLLDGWT